MEGAALRRKSELDHAIFVAWHTAVFGLTGYSGKLKRLTDYLADEPLPKGEAIAHAQAISFFHKLKAQGVPVKIYRTTRNEIN